MRAKGREGKEEEREEGEVILLFGLDVKRLNVGIDFFYKKSIIQIENKERK